MSSYRNEEELDDEKKQIWIEDITNVKQLKSQRIESYVLRLKELIKRGVEIYKTKEDWSIVKLALTPLRISSFNLKKT